MSGLTAGVVVAVVGGGVAGVAAAVVGAGWAGVVAAVAVRATRRARRRRPPVSPGHSSSGQLPRRAGGAHRATTGLGHVARLGAAVRRLAPVPSPPAPTAAGHPSGPPPDRSGVEVPRRAAARRMAATRPVTATADAPVPATAGDVVAVDVPGAAGAADVVADRRAGWATLAGAGLLVVSPALAAVPLVWAVAAPVLGARRRRARVEGEVHDQLPDVVDLLALTAAAGLPVGAAVVALGRRPGGPVGDALGAAAGHVVRGGGTADALALLSAAGPALRPLVEALAQHDRYGSPLLPALERVAIEARARRRRRAEEAARRLPVTLLLPLVLTTFPAFVLLTVVPLLAGSLGSLSLSPT